MASDVHPDRVRSINDAPVDANGTHVLYWMSAAQRVTDNHALAYATTWANRLGVPVRVCFAFMDTYPDATTRSLTFLLEGLRDVAGRLGDLGIGFEVAAGDAVDIAVRSADGACAVVCDRGYLRLDRTWRQDLGQRLSASAVEVETNIVVPVDLVSDRHEYAARTLRPRIRPLIDDFLSGTDPVRPAIPSRAGEAGALHMIEHWLDGVARRGDVPVSTTFRGGESEALKRLAAFVDEDLPGYAIRRRDPALRRTSELSPYLHFGQLSPVTIARAVTEAAAVDDADALIEQLVVRRELAINHVTHEPRYDTYAAVPDWAHRTLDRHRRDPRPYLVDVDSLTRAASPDRYWNAAMTEMLTTGYMHNYMRMYWGKKIIEWTDDPMEAFGIIRMLNDRYFIDGRDPVSYTSIAWLFGLHDRPWPEREVFGTVRTMTAHGLRRKFDIDAYVATWTGLGL